MNKRVIVMSIFFIWLLLVSTTTSSYLVPLNNKIETKEKIYVDPNIRLTRNHLSILKNAVANHDNQNYDSIITEIIFRIEQKGVVVSKDVKEIIDKLSIEPTKIYYLKLITCDYESYYEQITIFPGDIILHTLGNYIGLTIFLEVPSCDAKIGSHNISGERILAIGFLGMISDGSCIHQAWGSAIGLSLLIII
jgi:hypothetical protein